MPQLPCQPIGIQVPGVNRYRWSLALLISLLAAGICITDGAESPDLQHKMRAFKTDIPIPLDGDLAKWRGADTVTFEGKPLAGHPLSAFYGTKKLFMSYRCRFLG